MGRERTFKLGHRPAGAAARWPLASLDRRRARRFRMLQAGTKERPSAGPRNTAGRRATSDVQTGRHQPRNTGLDCPHKSKPSLGIGGGELCRLKVGGGRCRITQSADDGQRQLAFHGASPGFFLPSLLEDFPWRPRAGDGCKGAALAAGSQPPSEAAAETHPLQPSPGRGAS